MKSRQILRDTSVAVLLLFLLCGAAVAKGDAPEKVYVLDGSFVHDVGELQMNVTNWGLLGSMPGSVTTWSDAPSAQWPRASGDEYLWAAGLWVGGVVLGESLVTTGGWTSEFGPNESPEETIYRTVSGAPGGVRYPWPGADDDGDGLEDEEILNGLDDDGDGAIDEDFAAMSDQEFVATYRDNEATIVARYPDHTPLDIEVVQRSLQWAASPGNEFVGYDFTVTNIGVIDIDPVYLGLFSDHDIGPRGADGIAADDYAGSYQGDVEASDGTMVHVAMSYMYDGAAVDPVGGYVGWVLCGHSADADGSEASVRVYQGIKAQTTFAQGGDPTNDDERYQLMSATPDYWDMNVIEGQQSDYRTLISSGPFDALAPGESLHYAVAMVAGDGLQNLLRNAADAILAYRGVSYDRDGDPANGEEFVVHWLREDEAPVASLSGTLAAHKLSRGVELRLETNAGSLESIALVRRESAGVPERVWSSDRFLGSGARRSLVDTDDVGWPRDYELVYFEGGAQLTLAKLSVSMPAVSAAEVAASPNPFNPQVNLTLRSAAADRALLRVFDVRGRYVATLHDGPFTGGERTLTWDGRDHAGRAQASGVYEVRLETESEIVRTRITLLR